MTARKGFTLIELMVVVLIVGILAAVAIPIMNGRIDAAKWSEGKAGSGTIASAIRAYAGEKDDFAAFAPNLVTDLGLGANDLDGTYFTQACYVPTAVSSVNGQVAFTITVTAATSTRTAKPTAPATKILSQVAGAASVWN